MRTLEYYDYKLKGWFDIVWPNVVSGTLIKITEEDGTPVLDGTGIHELRATSSSYKTTVSGVGTVWQVDIADSDTESISKRSDRPQPSPKDVFVWYRDEYLGRDLYYKEGENDGETPEQLDQR